MAEHLRAQVERLGAYLNRHWVVALVALWIGAMAWMLWVRWGGIHWFALPDTDDNIRMDQVRDWLNGQGWYDLRQYRLNPPGGFDIHWSRFVDLPIAGIILALRPFVGGAMAEKTAVALAPMLPLAIAMAATAVTARRLVAPIAAIPAAALILLCQSALFMFMPLRIDHHGWQLAMLAATVAGLTDPRAARGGAIAAISTVISLVIGLEMLPFLAIAGGAIVLRWVWEGATEAERMRTYALGVAGGSAIGYVLFASYANRAPVCDALSPVWLSALLLAGALLYPMSLLRSQSRAARFLVAGAAGAVVACAFAVTWPGCLTRPEHVSPELDRLWLSNVKEARPITLQKRDVIIGIVTMPIVGLVGAIVMCWRTRRDARAIANWATILLMALLSCAMLFWQARIGAGAQIIALPGAAALGWLALGWMWRQSLPVAGGAATAAAAAIAAWVWLPPTTFGLPASPARPALKIIGKANARCPTLPALAPIAKLPATTIMTFVDLGPRLITVTHHSAIAGPYHRNGDAILDVHHAFDGPPEQARAIAKRHGATLLLTCPNMSESTIYRSRSPNGFYARLSRGEKFDWLTPVPLPASSPLKLWRIS